MSMALADRPHAVTIAGFVGEPSSLLTASRVSTTPHWRRCYEDRALALSSLERRRST